MPQDYPFIKSGIITDMEQLIDIMLIFFNKKIYLHLEFRKFIYALGKGIVGKNKLVEIIGSASDEQLKKLVELEKEICNQASWGLLSFSSILAFFLKESRDSDKVQRVLNIVLQCENLKAYVSYVNIDYNVGMHGF